MNITLICVGKLKEKYLTDACNEYIKRLSANKVGVIEIAPERLSENPGENEIKSALEKEGKRILEKVPKNSFVYAMCIEGKQRSSEELSAQLEKIKIGGTGSLVFIIGGSFGLSDEVKKRANDKLSMSKMTFPHQLARVMLLEQIYRSVQIELGTRYHK